MALFGGMFGDIFDFEKSAMGDRKNLLKKDPWRIPLGIMDEGGTKIWNTVLGKDMEPVVDYWGGTTKQNVANAKAKGINTGPGEGMHNIARTIASLFAGNYGAGKLGGGMFGSGGSNPMPMDMSADAIGQASQGSTGAFGSGPASSPMDWAKYANLGSKLMQGFGEGYQQPQQEQQSFASRLYQPMTGAQPTYWFNPYGDR